MSSELAAHGGPDALAGLDPALANRFSDLWLRCADGADPAEAEWVYGVLRARYREPHRRYHDLNHLAACLDQFDLAAGEISRPDAVEMAIWFHDVINDPGARDNEARSAQLFRDLSGSRLHRDLSDTVVRLILATTHATPPVEADERWICDIDLTSFGCPWECYLRDTHNLIAEFPGTEAEYYRRQRSFLEGLQARPRIFTTNFFRDQYEERARDNIARLLAIIDARQAP